MPAPEEAAITAADENMEISGKCAFEGVHDEFNKNKKIILLDDGFTALSIKKNINIIIIDATVDIFIQNVMPAGILREPLSALKYADIIVVNKSYGKRKDFEIKIRKFNEKCLIFYSGYEPVGLIKEEISGINVNGGGQNIVRSELPLSSIKGKKIISICAIGNPDYFYDNLISCGACIEYKIEFRDHYIYKETDIKTIGDMLNKNKEYMIITTSKDYVKLKRFNKSDIFDKIYYLDFKINVDKVFFEYIHDKYNNSEKK